jgi:hypothetical protein
LRAVASLGHVVRACAVVGWLGPETAPSVTVRLVRIAAAAAITLALMAGLVSVPLSPRMQAAAWSALMLLSFVGWGSLVNLWLDGVHRVDWGLRAGWGMVLFLVVGGFLCCAHVSVQPVLIAQVGAGVVAFFAACRPRLTRAWPAFLRRRVILAVGRSGVSALVIGAYAMAGLSFFAALGNHWFNPSDDLPLYFVLAKKIVQTGSIYEPFAVRRLLTFGAQAYLHASFMSVAPIYYLGAVDGGICLVLVFSLLLGLACGTSRAPSAVGLGAAMLLLFSLQEVRTNTNSEVSSLAALLTLYRTVRVPLGESSDRQEWPPSPRRVVAVATIATVCVLLRTSNAPCVLLFVFFVLASDYLLGNRRPWARPPLVSLLRTTLIFVAACAIALLPWSIMLWQSCGTFFYPLWKGNASPGWVVLEPPKDSWEAALQLSGHLFFGKPVALLVPFVIAGLTPLAGRARNDLAALSAASLLGLVVLARQSAAFPEADAARYYFPFVAAAALAVAASAGRLAIGAVLVSVALAAHLALSRDDTRTKIEGYVTSAHDALGIVGKEDFDAPTFDYQDVQDHIPAGATVVDAVFEGFRFDYRRNRVLSLDVLGGMGPKPGWPTHAGADVLGNYLRSCGVQYLVWVDFDLPSEFYNRAHWTSHLAKSGSYLRREAALLLDAEDAIEKLSANHHVLYQAHGMTVVDLSAAP